MPQVVENIENQQLFVGKLVGTVQHRRLFNKEIRIVQRAFSGSLGERAFWPAEKNEEHFDIILIDPTSFWPNGVTTTTL